MWQFSQAVRGLADGCAALGDSGDRRQRQLLQPDRVPQRSCPRQWVGVLGVIDDVTRRIPTGLGSEAGETLMLLGDNPRRVRRLHLGAGDGRPPGRAAARGRPGARESCWPRCSARRSRDGLVSRGSRPYPKAGWPQAIVESALAG